MVHPPFSRMAARVLRNVSGPALTSFWAAHECEFDSASFKLLSEVSK